MGDFSVGRAAFFGFGMIRRDPLSFLGATLVTSLVGIAAVLLLWRTYIDMLTLSFGSDVATDPDAMLADVMRFYGAMVPFYGVSFVLGLIAMGAIYRSLIFDGHWGWFLGLKLGLDELRLFLLLLALSFVIGVPYLLGALGVVAAIAGVSTATESTALTVLTGLIAALLLFVVIIWLMVRFTPTAAMTIAERRFSLFRAFKITKGKAWSIFAAYLVLYLVLMLVYSLVSVGFFALMGSSVLTTAADPEAVLERARNVSLGPLTILGSLLYGFIVTLFSCGFYGVSVYTYRVLAPDVPEGLRLSS